MANPFHSTGSPIVDRMCRLQFGVYEDVEEFLEKSGWRRDNPELCSECYLFENHICRKIQGKIWYFSRIQYENGLRGMKQGFN